MPPEVRTERRKIADAGRNRAAEGRYTTSSAQTSQQRRNRVVELVAQGQGTEQISAAIGITPRAVRQYRRDLPLNDSSEKAIGPHASPSTKEVRTKRIQELLEQGLSTSQIATELDMSARSVRRYAYSPSAPSANVQLSTAATTEAIARLVFKEKREIERFRDPDWARSLLAKGYSCRQVAEVTGFSKSMVSKLSTAGATEAIARLVCGRSPTRSVAPQGPRVVDAKR